MGINIFEALEELTFGLAIILNNLGISIPSSIIDVSFVLVLTSFSLSPMLDIIKKKIN